MAEFSQFQSGIKPEQIIEIIIRRRWLIIIPLCITLSFGLVQCFISPRTYEAFTSILVQPQSVPGSYVRSVVTMDINARISTISQQIMSYSNLSKIIDQFGLFEGPGSEEMYLEDKIKAMRKRIKVDITRARGGTDAFAISYKGEDPERVMRIANTLTSYFMDENLKVREAQAVGTSEFLESELEKTRKKLVEREKRLSEYRANHLGGLPDELESNLRTLDRLQQQLTDKQAMIMELKNSINMLNTQITQSKEMASQNSVSQFDFLDFEEEETFLSEEEQKIADLEDKLDTLLLRYTENHPDVRKLTATIEKLKARVEKQAEKEEAQKAEEIEETAALEEMDFPQAGTAHSAEADLLPAEASSDSGDPSAGDGPGGFGGTNFAMMQQEMQLKQMQNELKKLNSDVAKINKAMEVYEKRVEETPRREQEMISLKRDYENIRSVYSSLLDRKLEAELSVNMEKKQKGEQFRILDHARIPQKPITPDIRKIFIFALAAGMAFGGGVIFLLEFFNSSIRSDEEIEEELGLPILASVPALKSRKDIMRARFMNLMFGLMGLYIMMIFLFFYVIDSKGISRVIDFIKMHIMA